MLKFIPVRGRKQVQHVQTIIREGLKFIPVRGRKPLGLFVGLIKLSLVEIYPREGTETVVKLDFSIYAVVLKFIPVRGRKRFIVLPCGYNNLLKFIPVRGRKHGIALPTLIVVER